MWSTHFSPTTRNNFYRSFKPLKGSRERQGKHSSDFIAVVVKRQESLVAFTTLQLERCCFVQSIHLSHLHTSFLFLKVLKQYVQSDVSRESWIFFEVLLGTYMCSNYYRIYVNLGSRRIKRYKISTWKKFNTKWHVGCIIFIKTTCLQSKKLLKTTCLEHLVPVS